MGLWVLSSKHWAAPASAPVDLELVTTNTHATHLEVVSELAGGPTKLGVDGGQRGLEDRVLDLLGQGTTLTRAKLRDARGQERVCVTSMVAPSRKIEKVAGGEWCCVDCNGHKGDQDRRADGKRRMPGGGGRAPFGGSWLR
jgi:hypothetical protein